MIGKELFIDPYSDDLLWILWSNDDESTDTPKQYNVPSYSLEEDTFNMVLPFEFDVAISHFMRNGRCYGNEIESAVPLTNSIHKPIILCLD